MTTPIDPVDPSAPLDRSYRAVFAIPDLGRVVFSMQLARIAQAMVSVALVLFSLAEFSSPAVAGVVTFAILLPGILLSPIAGALLDRHGRVRLIVIDYIVAMTTMILVGGLAMAGVLTAPLLVVIAAVSSMTGPFSQTGLRSLFPMMAPRHLWERVNALDSSGYVVATIIGPPLAAAMVAILGPRVAVMAIAIPYALAALVLLPVREPKGTPTSSGKLLVDAWQGVRYVWGNRSLRGLGFSISTLNLAGGISTIAIPILVLQRLGGTEAMVGVVFALSGVAGVVSVGLSGRIDSRRREWLLLVVPMAFMGPAALLHAAGGEPRRTSAWRGRPCSRRSSSPGCSTGPWTSACSRCASGAPTRRCWVARSRSRWPSTSWAIPSAPPSVACWRRPRSTLPSGSRWVPACWARSWPR